MSQSDSHGRIARGHVSVSASLHERLAAYCARTGVTMSAVLEHVTADLPNVDADRVPLPVSHRMRRHALFAARERRWSLDDTMERAIDLFVRHRVSEVPVIDKDGELIGVVSTHELLRVCLPDYVLWMDDLTPIINFEPLNEPVAK